MKKELKINELIKELNNLDIEYADIIFRINYKNDIKYLWDYKKFIKIVKSINSQIYKLNDLLYEAILSEPLKNNENGEAA